ncbi:helicase-related protein [Metabacillus niabensis]|uniref:helicase-related protein n=1 Tax=Metabacillus niabensis TaxID=324854 RepID=UPI0039A31D94
MIIFQKKSLYLKEIPYQVKYIESPTINELGAKKIYKEYIHELLKSKNEIRAKLLFEAIKNNPTDNNFEYKVKKLLFDIKRNPKLQHYLGKAEDYIHKYYSQTKPEDIDWTEWNRVKITEKKVISYLKNVIKKQHEKELDVIKLVKDRYGLKYKAYSHKAKIRLNKYNKPSFIAFADIVQNDIKDFANSPYRKLIKRKLLEYKKQIKPYAIMGKDNSVEDFLDEFYLYNYNKNQRITLNNVQRLDMSKILQKKYNIIQWECGCGKSLAGITFLKFHQTQKNIKHGIVIAPAIAIEEWTEFLSDYKIPFKNIRSLKDIESIKCGEILLITLNMVIKYQNQLKKFIKINNRKFALLFDESHTISNINSKRTKAVLNVFRRLPYKLLTSATLTKNNIAEIFPQLDLLYNSSHNFINESETIIVKNKKTNRIEKKKNQYYMKAYPPYKKGYRLFQETHNPQKITVFGAEANTQDIYSADTLQKLINRTIITRNFEEIAGRKIYAIEQKTCKMSAPEKDLYNLIINDFYKLTYRFTKIENTRKESFLKIIRQINLLIKSTSTPHLFREWTGDTYSTKFEEVASLINKYEGKQIAVGCLFIETVDSYKKFLKERYPDRPVVVITGEHTSLTQRKKIINKLKEDSMKDAILLCTQQSLSSSLNINFIDTVIIPEIYWNDPTMRQFYFRFIRLNSERDKKVYFVTYENSIESNMLQLVLAKEKLNLFMKDIIVSEDSLHKEYGIDFNILEMLLRKEWDQNGNVHLSWGTQTIAN